MLPWSERVAGCQPCGAFAFCTTDGPIDQAAEFFQQLARMFCQAKAARQHLLIERN